MNFNAHLPWKNGFVDLGEVKRSEDLLRRNVEVHKPARREGTTTIKPFNNVKEAIESATKETVKSNAPQVDQNVVLKKAGTQNTQLNTAHKVDDYNDNYRTLISEILKDSGLTVDDSSIDAIFIALVQAHVDGELSIKVNISTITQLIDINLRQEHSDVSLITQLIDKLLNNVGSKELSDTADVEKFILDKALDFIDVQQTPQENQSDIPTIDLDGFFKGEDNLTAYQIYNDKYGYLYGDDEVAKEILTAINDVAKKLGIQVQPKEYQNLVNGIITKINDIYGVENTNPPVLSKSTLNKYFTNHSIEDLIELINSPDIENAYYQEALKALGMDDVLGDFAQNKKEGDCYFLSTLYSVANTPNGAALLANAFGTVEIDGITHYTFTFKGGYRNKNGDESANNYCRKTTTYTFSPKEILEAVKNGYGAGGDVNAIVAEMALEALMKDQVYTNKPNTAYRNGYLANGTGVQVMHLLTGDCGANTRYTSSGSEFKNMVMNLLRNGSIQEGTTGNYMMYFGFEGHARAVVGVSEEGVTYIDPYNSSQKLFMSWDRILGNPTTYKNFQWANIPEQN